MGGSSRHSVESGSGIPRPASTRTRAGPVCRNKRFYSPGSKVARKLIDLTADILLLIFLRYIIIIMYVKLNMENICLPR